MIDEKQLMKLQNGSDIRGTAVAGIADEPVNLTQEAVRCITGGFLDFLTEKNGKPVTELTIAVGHDSRISAPDLKRAVRSAILSRGAKAIDCGLSSTPAMFMSILFDETKADGSSKPLALQPQWHEVFHRTGRLRSKRHQESAFLCRKKSRASFQ